MYSRKVDEDELISRRVLGCVPLKSEMSWVLGLWSPCSSREHWVTVDPDRDDKPVRCFSTFSNDLYALADWLKSLDVEVIAIRFDRGGNLIGEGW